MLTIVDAHTAHHLYHTCLLGSLMKGRTVILVSHHVQLCAPNAKYIVALENGRAVFQGDYKSFTTSGVAASLVQTEEEPFRKSRDDDPIVLQESSMRDAIEQRIEMTLDDSDMGNSHDNTVTVKSMARKAPRKLIEEEKRAVGRIGKDIWKTYIIACGRWVFWSMFGFILILSALNPVLLNGWVRYVIFFK